MNQGELYQYLQLVGRPSGNAVQAAIDAFNAASKPQAAPWLRWFTVPIKPRAAWVPMRRALDAAFEVLEKEAKELENAAKGQDYLRG